MHVELAYRLHDRGLRFVFALQARGWHYARRSFASWLRIPQAYGRNDVVMGHDHSHKTILQQLGSEFHDRHVWLRMLVHLCVGRPRVAATLARLFAGLAWLVGRVSSPWGYRLAGACYSVIFNLRYLRYYQGASEQLGIAEFWALIADHAPGA